MHAYAIIGSKSSTQKHAINLAQKLGKQIFEDEILKISDLGKFLTNTSLTETKKTVYVLNNFDQASIETQNAFLKRLEEPQENISYILTAQNEQSLLPTILSRVSIKRIYEKSEDSNNKDILHFLNSTINEKLEKISKIKKREDAIQFVQKAINTARNNKNQIKYLESLEQTYVRLQANGNASLQLTNLIVMMDAS